MELTPPGSGFGVELRGADIAENGTLWRLRAAFAEHSLLVFRDQRITDDSVAPVRRLGPLEITRSEPLATRRGSTYLHRWRPGDLVMWDNRA